MARDLHLFYLFRLLATSYLWVPVSVLFPQSRGLGFDQVMLLSAIYSGVIILVEAPTGALADRIGRRQSMLAGSLAMLLAGVTSYFADSFGAFAASNVLAAMSMALCSGADSAYLFDLLHQQGRGHEYPHRESISSAWHQAGLALACLAGGILGEIDLALPYLATSAVAAAAFVITLLMRPERPVPQRTSSIRDELRIYLDHMKLSLGAVRKSRMLAWVIAYSAVVFVLVRSTEYLYQPYLDQRGFSISEIGAIFAGVFLVASLGAHRTDALRRWLGEETMVYGLLGVLSLSFILLNQLHGELAPLLMLGIQALAIGMYSPLVKTMLNRQITNSDQRATILSVESIARRGAKGLFSPLAGYAGATSAIYLCGAVGLIGFVALVACAGKVAPAVGRLPHEPRTPRSETDRTA